MRRSSCERRYSPPPTLLPGLKKSFENPDPPLVGHNSRGPDLGWAFDLIYCEVLFGDEMASALAEGFHLPPPEPAREGGAPTAPHGAKCGLHFTLDR